MDWGMNGNWELKAIIPWNQELKMDKEIQILKIYFRDVRDLSLLVRSSMID